MISDEEIRQIFNYKTVAVVGCSPKEERPSHQIALYLRQVGYTIIPVNPGYTELLGEKCYPNLLQIPVPVDIVNIFRRSETVYPIVQEAIRIRAKVLWMQDGISHAAAATLATQAGLKVVMDDCIFREHQRLLGPFRKTIPTC